MNICFVLGQANNRSGITKVVVNIANLLAENSQNNKNIQINQVSIVCVKEMKENDNISQSGNVRLTSLGAKGGKISCYLSAAFKIKKYVLKNHVDVLVVSGMEWVPFYLAGTVKLPVSILAWEHRNFGACPILRLEWIGKRLACRYCQGIINITKRDKQLYRMYSSGVRLFQIYNVNGVKQEAIQYNIESKKIISVGYLSWHKGFDMLVDVAAKVLPKNPEWSWDIYGEGDLRNMLEEKIKKYHLEGRLHLMGWISNIQEIYRDYGIYVFTSRMEGMGMVLVEAQKNRLPVVSFDVPCGPSDTVIDGVNGFLVDTFDLDKMVERINLLIEKEELRKMYAMHTMDCHGEMDSSYILRRWQEILASIGGGYETET